MKKSIKEKVLEIMALALEFNCSEAGSDNTNKKPAFFVDYAGHVNYLTVKVYKNGWGKDVESDMYEMLLIHDRMYEKKLDDIIEYMKEVYKEWENKDEVQSQM